MVLHRDGGLHDDGSFFGGDRESGGLSQAGVCVQVPAAANDRSTTAAATSELLRRLLPPTGAFLLYPTPTWCLLKSAQKREFGFSAGNTSAQLVPRVFSLGSSSSCCTLVTMLTIYPLVHHVMKKASNCVCSTLCTFHSSILKKTGITCMAIIIQFHDVRKSYSVLLGAVIIALVYTPWQSLCLPIQSSSSYTIKMCFGGKVIQNIF